MENEKQISPNTLAYELWIMFTNILCGLKQLFALSLLETYCKIIALILLIKK